MVEAIFGNERFFSYATWKKVGLIGFGFIGKMVAKIFQGFSVEIIYFDICRATLKKRKY